MQKTGTLKVVASTGGLRLFSDKEGVWNNPVKDITPEILEHLKALKGKNVVIIFNDKGRYISCEPNTADNKDIATYPTNEEKSAPQQAKSDYISTQTSSVRQSSLKISIDLITAFGSRNNNLEETAKEVTQLAEIFEKWVNRK